MSDDRPYNPLDKTRLAESAANALMGKQVETLPPRERFKGAGVYAIYYIGDFPAYAPIAQANKGNRFEAPIYVGKADPKGGRKGGGELDSTSGNALFNRLNKHGGSVDQASNLGVADFRFRYLVMDDIWIRLTEGTPMLFYESGRDRGRAAVIAVARVVRTNLLLKGDILSSVLRRGVLERRTIERVSASESVAATTFDNIMLFGKPVRLGRLRNLGCVDGSNLVTARRVSAPQFSAIVSEGEVSG